MVVPRFPSEIRTENAVPGLSWLVPWGERLNRSGGTLYGRPERVVRRLLAECRSVFQIDIHLQAYLLAPLPESLGVFNPGVVQVVDDTLDGHH